MTRILGISAYYHDSAACLLEDGRIVAAAQEERFTRRKHDASFPERAIEYCLREGGISAGELDVVGFYEKPLLKFDRLVETYTACEQRFPHSLGLLYSAFTYHAGFRVNSGEYKLMGLAPYGEPVYVRAIKEHLLEIHDDGSLWMNMEYFTYAAGLTMTGARFDALFG